MSKRPTCQTCQRALSVCLCPHIQHVDNLWPIRILQHANEKKHAIGTAKIAQLSLKNCETYLYQPIDPGSTFEQWLKKENPVLIYPGEHAEGLDALNNQNPRTLLLLDASWRKSRRMLHESPQLEQLQRVCIQPSKPSSYTIRKVPSTTSLSTLEAIVEILSELENDQNKYQPLLNTMDWMINKQIEHIDPELFEQNYIKVEKK
ncbi:MAG: DTW domain-containing protein [Pseudomonadales bacterium]|nr:DTW domain-containing protein [Pseudomonadales bacterium]